MKVEDVPATHVEAACEAAWDCLTLNSQNHWTADHIEMAGPSPTERARLRKQMRHALAAVAPLIAARERERVAALVKAAAISWHQGAKDRGRAEREVSAVTADVIAATILALD